MKRKAPFSAMLASVVVGAAFTSMAAAVGPALNPADHTQWNENPYNNGFGGAIPAGAVESFMGFETIADFSGRVLSNADVTSNTVDNSVLASINSGLFPVQDANLYKIQITNPAAFSASIPSTSFILALFDANGNGIAASQGGTADALTGANTGITTPGQYYIGIATSGDNPENASGQNIFGLTGSAGVFPAVTSDKTLSTDPFTAWTHPGDGATYLLGDTSFGSGSSSIIALTGTNFSVVPEPTTLGLLGAASLGLLGRRRNRAS